MIEEQGKVSQDRTLSMMDDRKCTPNYLLIRNSKGPRASLASCTNGSNTHPNFILFLDSAFLFIGFTLENTF